MTVTTTATVAASAASIAAAATTTTDAATTMMAAVAHGYGGAEVLQVQEVARPALAANKVLVKVHAASASRADSMMLTGKPYLARLFMGLNKPKHNIPGTGFSGEIVAIGEKVTEFAVGDLVFGESGISFGSNAEYVAVAADGVILKKPDTIPHSEACTLCDGPLTSLNFLKELAGILPGEKVLVNGASGSLGTAAVQLARYMGAEVTGVCSTRNVGLVKELGAHHVIDYTKQDFTQNSGAYDVIYDTVGKSSFSQCKRALTKGGQYITPVLTFKALLQMMGTAVGGGKRVKFDATGMKKPKDLRPMAAQLLEIVREGKLKTVTDRQFPLAKVPEAHRYIGAGHKKGNVVIMVQANG